MLLVCTVGGEIHRRAHETHSHHHHSLLSANDYSFSISRLTVEVHYGSGQKYNLDVHVGAIDHVAVTHLESAPRRARVPTHVSAMCGRSYRPACNVITVTRGWITVDRSPARRRCNARGDFLAWLWLN